MAVNINVPSQVKTYANLAAFPASGSLKTIYIAEDTNKTYRWTGSVYVEISASAAMTWGQIGGTLSNQTDLQNALDAKVPTSRTLTINGVTQDLSANRTFTISTGITIGSTAIASGVVGRVLFEGAGNVVQQSSSLFWDATNNRLGIGTSTPAYTIDSIGSIKMSALFGKGIGTSDRYFSFDLEKPTGTIPSIVFGAYDDNATRYLSFGGEAGSTKYATQYLYFFTGATNTTVAGTRAMAILPSGNINIGSNITDAGFRLDVNGTARVQGQATIAGTTNASAGLGRNALINGTITATANTQTLIGLDIEPTFNTGAFTGVETLALRVTGFISNFTSSGATQLRIIGPSGSNKSLFFFNSSTTFASTRIYNAATTNHLIFATGDSLSNPTDRLAIFASTGNIGINTTTDAGFRLDVNGTARINQTLRVNGSGTAQLINLAGNGIILNHSTGYIFQSSNSSNMLTILNGFVGVNSITDIPSAILAADSTTRGFLPPRMTTTQINAIASPAEGLMVYNTTISHMCVYQAGSWVKLSHSPM